MSFSSPAFRTRRRSVFQPAGEAGLWVKIFDPPTESPATPDRLDLLRLPRGVRANPVPEVMEAAGLSRVSRPHTVQRDLMHGATIDTWDERPGGLFYGLFRDGDTFAAKDGTYPAATIRVPRGAIFQAEAQGHGPPPHTIHWHGIEPTSINDGVGHCSMEIGDYIYQWQPNFIGTFFYHCHRNTTQHFELGMFGLLIIHPPDAFFATQRSRAVPIGAGEDGLFRTAANLKTPVADFMEMFPGFVGGDPVNGVANGDPHAFTVPYDVEALWVLDDRDSVWSDFAPDPRAFLGRPGDQPGVNDRFVRGFFHDFNADYWFVTGVPVVPDDRRKRLGNVGTIHPDLPPPIGGSGGVDLGSTGQIPPGVNSGVFGGQIAINAQVGQTILIRCLDAAYNNVRITFPADVVIIEVDGRALGVPPFGRYNHAFLLRAGTPILICTARRFACLMRPDRSINAFAIVEFIESQGDTLTGTPSVPLGPVVQTAKIPIVIS